MGLTFCGDRFPPFRAAEAEKLKLCFLSARFWTPECSAQILNVGFDAWNRRSAGFVSAAPGRARTCNRGPSKNQIYPFELRARNLRTAERNARPFPCTHTQLTGKLTKSYCNSASVQSGEVARALRAVSSWVRACCSAISASLFWRTAALPVTALTRRASCVLR